MIKLIPLRHNWVGVPGAVCPQSCARGLCSQHHTPNSKHFLLEKCHDDWLHFPSSRCLILCNHQSASIYSFLCVNFLLIHKHHQIKHFMPTCRNRDSRKESEI